MAQGLSFALPWGVGSALVCSMWWTHTVEQVAGAVAGEGGWVEHSPR